MKRMIKIIFVAVLGMIMFSLPGQIQAEESSDRPAEPHIVIASDRWMPVFKAGEKATLSIPYKNTATGSAKDATIALAVTDLEKFPFRSDKMSFTNYASSIGEGSYVSSFNVSVPSNMKSGTYPITVNITYSTESGGAGSASATLYVKITNEMKQANLKFMEVTFDGDRLSAGKSTLVHLKIKNEGDLALHNIELRLTGFTSEGINLDKWPEVQGLQSMKANETRSVEYRLYVDPNLKTGIYPLDLNMKYKDESEAELTRDSKVYFPISGKDEQDELIPRIMIDNYQFGSDVVLAGESFPLSLSIVNTSEAVTLKNIKISLSSEGQIFSPLGNSNSFYIPRLAPQGKFEKTLQFKAKNGAENQTYAINAEIDYQDAKGTKLNEKEVISVPVMQEVKLMVAEPELPPEVFVDNPTSISVDFHNTGRSLIRNLTIRTEGDFEIKNGGVYVGNLEAGKSDYYDVTITAHKEGKLEGRVIFEYENDTGELFQLEKKLTLQVAKAPEGPPMGMEEPMPEKNKFAFQKWMIPAGIAVLAIVGFLLYRRRKAKKAKLEELDFDE